MVDLEGNTSVAVDGKWARKVAPLPLPSSSPQSASVGNIYLFSMTGRPTCKGTYTLVPIRVCQPCSGR